MPCFLSVTTLLLVATARGQNFPEPPKWLEAVPILARYASVSSMPDFDSVLPTTLDKMAVRRDRQASRDLRRLIELLPDLPLLFTDLRSLRSQMIELDRSIISARPAEFQDIASHHWASDAVGELAGRRLLKGYPEAIAYRPIAPSYRPLTEFAPNSKGKVDTIEGRVDFLVEAYGNIRRALLRALPSERAALRLVAQQLVTALTLYEKGLHRRGLDSKLMRETLRISD